MNPHFNLKKALKACTVLLLLLPSINCYAQNNASYDIKITVKGLSEGGTSKLLLLIGDKPRLIDTAVVQKDGIVHFNGKELLPAGYYYYVMSTGKYVQFMVDADQKFEIETDTANLNNLKYINQIEHDGFTAYIAELNAFANKYNAIANELKNHNQDSEMYNTLRDSLIVLRPQELLIKNRFIENNPTWLVAKYLKAQEKIKVPPKPKDSPLSDNFYTYLYYMAHFWDNIDLADERLLRTPLFKEKLDEYTIKRTNEQPDSVIKYVDLMINKLKADCSTAGLNYKENEIYRYVVSTLTGRYIDYKTMGHDRILVHMVDTYNQGDIPWVDEASLLRLRQKADKLRPCLVGKIGADIKAPNQKGEMASMYADSAEYTVIFFFSAGCDHCKEATPGVIKIYNDFKARGVNVFAVCTDEKEDDFPKYMAQFNPPWPHTCLDTQRRSKYWKSYDIGILPDFFLLGRDHKILAKDLNEKQIYAELDKAFKYLDEQKALEEK